MGSIIIFVTSLFTGAAAGTLTFMVGGSNADFEQAEPYLACMGKNIVHCGEACKPLSLLIQQLNIF